jgi:hypothetical protein
MTEYSFPIVGRSAGADHCGKVGGHGRQNDRRRPAEVITAGRSGWRRPAAVAEVLRRQAGQTE